MGEEEEEEKVNMMNLNPDLLEEIFLRLPLKSIIKLKIVSKRFRSILESRRFAERRRTNSVQTKPQFLVARKQLTVGEISYKVKEEEEVDIFYLDSDEATTWPSLACEGLVCTPVPGWVNVTNPCTGEVLRFPSGPDPVESRRYSGLNRYENVWDAFPGYWAMGFGRDKVNGSYKVVRMFFDTKQAEILDINIGQWRKLLNLPPCYIEARRKSACVNGSIYWGEFLPNLKILALDLHTEEFRHVPPPPAFQVPCEIVNLQDHLAIGLVAADYRSSHLEMQIWIIDEQEETWTLTYTIPLSKQVSRTMFNYRCRPLSVSKQGNLFFHDNINRLFEYDPNLNSVRLFQSCGCFISPFVEDLVSLGRSDPVPKYLNRYRISNFVRRIPHLLLRAAPDIMIITSVLTLVMLHSAKFT